MKIPQFDVLSLKCESKTEDVSFTRCNVVINFFENAHKVSVMEDSCEDCGSNLLQVDFSKVCLNLCTL